MDISKLKPTLVKIKIGRMNYKGKEYRFEWSEYHQHFRVFEDGVFFHNFTARGINKAKQDLKLFLNN